MPEPDGTSVRLRLDISYDGTGFSGWAKQPGRRTVQGELEAALSRILRCEARLTVAGRTDAGVHARGQVAHVDVPHVAVPHVAVSGADDSLLHRLAGVLPPDVRVRAVQVAPPGFDARFSARARRYAYRVTDAPWGAEPVERLDRLAWPRALDVAAMQAAADRLVGEHDFTAYCRRRDGASSIRTLQRLQWTRHGDLLTATVQADAFCHQMVRSLVGAMLAVGDGRHDVEWPGSLLALDRRADSVAVAPAHGLTLMAVEYPPDPDLAAQSERTRRVRSR